MKKFLMMILVLGVTFGGSFLSFAQGKRLCVGAYGTIDVIWDKLMAMAKTKLRLPIIGISSRLWLTPHLGLEGCFSYSSAEYSDIPWDYDVNKEEWIKDEDYVSKDENSIYLLRGGTLLKFKDAKNLDFYGGINLAIINGKIEKYRYDKGEFIFGEYTQINTYSNKEKEELYGIFYALKVGVEYFFNKLSNLGFSAEVGYMEGIIERKKEKCYESNYIEKRNGEIENKETSKTESKNSDKLKVKGRFFSQIAIHYYF